MKYTYKHNLTLVSYGGKQKLFYLRLEKHTKNHPVLHPQADIMERQLLRFLNSSLASSTVISLHKI